MTERIAQNMGHFFTNKNLTLCWLVSFLTDCFFVLRPIMHHNVRYNCRVLFLNRYISKSVQS